jgi:hypothetical protein
VKRVRKPNINKIRIFLKRNKIFFEVFSLLIIGFAGIIFGYFQWQVNKMQLHINEIEKQPLFRIHFSEEYKPYASLPYKPLDTNEFKRYLGFYTTINQYIIPRWSLVETPTYTNLWNTIEKDSITMSLVAKYYTFDKDENSILDPKYRQANKNYNKAMHRLFEKIYEEHDSIRRINLNKRDSVRRANWSTWIESYQIFNQGHPIKDLNYFIWTYYEVSHYINKKKADVYYIDLNSYMNWNYNVAINNDKNSVGLLVSDSSGGKMCDEYFRIWGEFRNDSNFKDTEHDSWYLSKHHLTRIKYMDVLNKNQAVYFSDELPISESSYKKIRKQLNERESVNPADVTIDMIKKICNKK